MTTVDRPQKNRVARGRARPRLLAVALAVAASAAVWAVASLLGVSLDVTSPAVGTIHIGILLRVLSALPLALGAWGVVALLDRYSSRPRRTWTVLSVAVLVASLVPLVFLDATAATRVSLAWMHVVCGLILIVLLRRTTLDRRGARRSNA